MDDVLPMIIDRNKWHYPAVTSSLSGGVTSKHKNDFCCLDC